MEFMESTHYIFYFNFPIFCNSVSANQNHKRFVTKKVFTDVDLYKLDDEFHHQIYSEY